MRSLTINRAVILSALSGLAATAPLSAQTISAQVLAYEGLSPLQVPSGAVYSTFGVPVISNDGRIVGYEGTLVGGGYTTSNDEFVFRTSLAPVQTYPIGREGTFVPNYADWFWTGGFGDVRVNNQGRVIFTGEANNVSNGNAGRGLFTSPNQAGTAMPGVQMAPLPTTAYVMSPRAQPSIDNAGRTVVGLNVDIDSQFFHGAGSTIRVSDPQVPGASPLLALTGDPAVHLGFSVSWTALPIGNPLATDDGRVYFRASHGGITGAAAQAIYQWTPESLTIVARGGPTSNPFVSLGEPSLVSAAAGGHALFTAKLLSLVTTEQNDDVLWRWTNGTRSVVAQEDDDAPGIHLSKFDWFSAESFINNSGDIVFTAGIRGLVTTGSNSAIYRDTGSGPQLIVQEGDAARGLTNAYFGQLYSATINNSGQIAFWNTLTGPGVTTDNDGALWVWTPGRGFTLVVREGDTFNPGFGSLRTLRNFSVYMGGPGEGQGTFLADTGRVVFRAEFTDNSSGILSKVVTPPCYANCDFSTVAPMLNVNDFICFQQKYAAGDAAANCDASTTAPVLNVNDFICFQQKYAAGCP